MHWALPPFEDSKRGQHLLPFLLANGVAQSRARKTSGSFWDTFSFPSFLFCLSFCLPPSLSLRLAFFLFPFSLFGAEIPLEDFEKKRILNPTKYGVTDYYYYPLQI